MNSRQTETHDDLQNGYMIRQAKDGFRFGIDAVLLAEFAYRALQTKVLPTEVPANATSSHVEPAQSIPPEPLRILDLGCGNGILPLLLAARLRDGNAQNTTPRNGQITGLEIRAEEAARAVRNVRENHLEDTITILNGDLKEAASFFDEASFDLVISNPPYRLPSEGKVSPNPDLAIARHEVACTFADVARAAAYALAPGGTFCLIHRSAREDEILQTLEAHALQPTRLRRVQPFADKAPNLFLVEAVRAASTTEMEIEEPLVIYLRQGVYTEEVLRMYGQHTFLA